MTNQPPSFLEFGDSLDPLTENLLDVLLETEDSYNWDPTNPDAEAYFQQLEAEFPLVNTLDDLEIEEQADMFFSRLNDCWSSVDNSDMKTSLKERFGQFVPDSWLETIVNKAQALLRQNLSQLNQLVECVKPLWSAWTEEDLEVFARPLAYAMRGRTIIKQGDWQELSEIEQIRFSMVIAQEVINELTSEQLQ
ncbi:hypothetical protein [Aphanothece sacrum]|uniref:Uncharacterized protein n=1 Tax=Aphanothece sacrum FPU1 TaxID=1920663 RepID=A0A401IBT5_APHSA|nr:hypothetical protein [Aphanothece sacrum]GBF78715.1 hypothetical protein AsFPU1_0104 [Aphanothece sacrum FPU1]GBF86944.1 hypothetical protein AsFPU3_4021 [Aphanothece sacrum FPU3]